MTTTAYEAPTLDLDGLRDCSAHHDGTSYRLANALEAFVATLDPHDAEWVAAAVNAYATSDEPLCGYCDGILRCRKCDDSCDDCHGGTLGCVQCNPPDPEPPTCSECGEDIAAPVCEECRAEGDDDTD